MSLDVYLTTKEKQLRKSSGIFVRENGMTVEISEDEWKERNPGQTPVRCEDCEESNTAYSANITHNLGSMAREAGIYMELWHPEDLHITKAGELIKPLTAGLALLKSDPERFKKFNSPNGWGLYENFVPWVQDYLTACREYPDAEVFASR